jgi:hypothetical protein
MTIQFKLNNSEYFAYLHGSAITLDVKRMGNSKKDATMREIVSTLGYYGPGQIDLVINRIIAEELEASNDVVNLREFLIRYKAIHESIASQVAELKEAIKQNRLQTT